MLGLPYKQATGKENWVSLELDGYFVVLTSCIQSGLRPIFRWCFSTASLLGAFRSQKTLFSVSLYMMFSWVTPNSSFAAFWACLSCCSVRGFILCTSMNFGMNARFVLGDIRTWAVYPEKDRLTVSHFVRVLWVKIACRCKIP